MEPGNQIKSRDKSKRDGFALAISMFVVVLLCVVGLGILSLGMHSRLQEVRACSEIAARSAADSGLTKALYEMNNMLNTKTWDDDSLPSVINEPLPNCNASYSYEVVKSTPEDANGNDIYNIESIGNSGWAQRTVSCTVEMEGIFEYAIFTVGDITLKNGTTVSAYNKKAGDPPLQIGTNSIEPGAITAKTGVIIDGDIVVGPGGDTDTVIDNAKEATVTGQTYPSLIKNKTPNINVPTSLLEMPSSGNLTSSTTLSSSAVYDSIDLTGSTGSELISVDGNVKLYVTGDLRLGNGDELQIQTDASLVIFLEGNLYIDNSGAINNLTNDSKKLKVYGLETCTNVDFKNSGVFYGAIYAPEANIRLHNGVQVYGAIVGNSFIQDVNADFHYDMSLREVAPNEIGVHLVVKRWREDYNHYRYRFREHFGHGTGGTGSEGFGSGSSGSGGSGSGN